jgi:methionine-gamma-lyase
MGDQTNAIHYTPFNPLDSRPLNTPIFQTSTFYFDNFKQIDDIFSLKERNFVYTRGGNPNTNLVEKRVARLEEGVDAVCFSSGMGAIFTTLISLLETGDTLIVSHVLYGSAMALVRNILGKFGIKVKVLDLTKSDTLKEYLEKDKNVKVIFFETPANPNLELIDIKKISDIAKARNLKVVVDNTFMGPYWQKPLNHGADTVVQSLTKYLNGHGDALGGISISKDQNYIDTLKFMYMCDIGTVLDPNSAFLILRGLKTYQIRMQQHEENSKLVSEFLSNHPRVKKVIFPGLDDYEYKNIKKKQMRGNGAIISFHLDNADVTRVQKFIESLKIFKLAVSLGDADSLVEYPLYMTHRYYLDKQDLKVYDELKTLIRLSIGLEDAQDLINDLQNAFKLL